MMTRTEEFMSEYIVLRQVDLGDSKITEIRGGWPSRVVLSQELIDTSDHITVDGALVTIMVSNGSAQYRIVDRSESHPSDWFVELMSCFIERFYQT